MSEIPDKIRTFIKGLARGHNYCEDTFYACPKHIEYCGPEEDEPIEERECQCSCDEARALVKEFNL